MLIQEDLVTAQNNDAVFKFELRNDDDNPVDLTVLTSITAYLKASEIASDGTAAFFGVGTGIVITNAVNGKITWTVPRADLTTAGTKWYHIDVFANSQITTYYCGNFVIRAV